jgi:hypothetical protein
MAVNLADPTTVIVTDGSPEAEASVMRARLEAARQIEESNGVLLWRDQRFE